VPATDDVMLTWPRFTADPIFALVAYFSWPATTCSSGAVSIALCPPTNGAIEPVSFNLEPNSLGCPKSGVVVCVDDSVDVGVDDIEGEVVGVLDMVVVVVMVGVVVNVVVGELDGVRDTPTYSKL
jgi:hypothetical protein